MKFCSRQCYWDTLEDKTPWNKGIKVLAMTGDKHPRWKGGTKSEKQKLLYSLEWKAWRAAVFTRDGYKCIDCGFGGYLEPHHIIPLKETLSRAFDINNGITLCRPCHIATMGKERELARTYFSLVQAQV
jgi:5-methylcytosine-specific restriction endonuclease McrA